MDKKEIELIGKIKNISNIITDTEDTLAELELDIVALKTNNLYRAMFPKNQLEKKERRREMNVLTLEALREYRSKLLNS